MLLGIILFSAIVLKLQSQDGTATVEDMIPRILRKESLLQFTVKTPGALHIHLLL